MNAHAARTGWTTMVTRWIGPLGLALTALAAGCEGFTIDQVFPVTNDATPALEIVAPTNGDRFDAGESVVVSVLVDDGDDDPVDVTVLVVSDLDGELCRIAPGVTGVAECASELSSGRHVLWVTGWDPLHDVEQDRSVDVLVLEP